MAMLRESPWYSAILEEGVGLGRQEGWQEGQAEMLLRILSRRFGVISPELILRVRGLGAEQLLQLVDVAVMAPSLDVVAATLASLPSGSSAGNGDGSRDSLDLRSS
jgi:hypothetical protein